MALLDGLIAVAILFMFAYFIYSRIKEKYPALGDFVSQFYSGGLINKTQTEMKKGESRSKEWMEKQKIM